MRRVNLLLLSLSLALPLAALAPGCGSDDGADAGTAAPRAAAADPRVAEAVTAYTAYVRGQIDLAVARTGAFTDAVRAGRLERARSLYAPSRQPWERIEPIAGLVEATDVAVDARVEAFAGPGAPAFTGWHRIEHILWARGTTEGAAPFADRLDRDLAELQRGAAGLEIPPAAMALGASELIQEVSEGKITGEEDRYSKTDLWDFAANVEGAERIVELLRPALADADRALLERIDAGFAELDANLDELRDGDGFVPFCQEDDPYPAPELCAAPTVHAARVDDLKGQLAGLSEDLAMVPGALGLT